MLKIARVAISLVFFLLIVFVFLDFSNLIPSGTISALIYLQFAPSLVKFINLISFGAAGFIFVLLMTVLFGRIYCSTLCPLGTFQDVISRISRRFNKRKRVRHNYTRPMNWLRYGLLALTVAALTGGIILMVDLLDPYSNFGRIINSIFRPAYIGINNLLAKVLGMIEIYTLSSARYSPVNWISLGFSLIWLGLIIGMSLRRGRLYCNTVCPVGTLLGLVSRVSAFRIRIDKGSCTLCGKCSTVCKAECIDIRAMEVDYSRCVGCMNCLLPCPEQGVKIKPARMRLAQQPGSYDITKRNFIRGSGILLAGLVGLGHKTLMAAQEEKEVIPGTVPVIRENPVTPPGSQSRTRFNELCTACHLCVSQCPTRVLQPTYFDYGLRGFMQPRMDYMTSFCNFECTLCGEICPTGAILPLHPEEKKLTQMGKTQFVKENCVVYTRKTDCGACSEHCPTKAVKMVPYEGQLTIPEVTNDICIGCGACEYACPTDPKSIYVEGNPEHQVAKEPEKGKTQQEEDYKEEFPF